MERGVGSRWWNAEVSMEKWMDGWKFHVFVPSTHAHDGDASNQLRGSSAELGGPEAIGRQDGTPSDAKRCRCTRAGTKVWTTRHAEGEAVP